MQEVQSIDQKIQNPILAPMSNNDHEQVVFCQDKATGLKAIIAIHNTVLGPALGGTRMWPYENEMEALKDVLRLSRGMTYKASISGLNLGGGKAVIIGDSRKIKSEALLRKFGRFVDSLSGKYITAEDVGMTTKDIEYMSMETDHVTGKPLHLGGSGDPSPVTAFGVYMGMKAAAKKAWGSDSLEGKAVTVQGVGHVGQYLVDYLAKEGALLTISDIYEDRIKLVSGQHNVNVVAPEAIFDQAMDIYAPCALGATVNDETLNKLSCRVIAGAANNQLADEKIHGERVREMGIHYAPDFVINAGGLINCYSEIQGYSSEAAMAQAEDIYNTTMRIFDFAEANGLTNQVAAIQLAEKRIQEVAKINQSW